MNEFVSFSNIEMDQSLFSYNQVLVFNLGFNKPAIDSEVHWIYVPANEINFYRAGYYNNIIGSKNLSMYIEIGYPKEYVISQEIIGEQLNLTLKNLKKMKIIDDHRLVDYQSVVMNPAYVHITKEATEAIDKLKKMLNANNVYTVGRYGDWKYCSIEDCMIDSLNTISKIKKITAY